MRVSDSAVTVRPTCVFRANCMESESIQYNIIYLFNKYYWCRADNSSVCLFVHTKSV